MNMSAKSLHVTLPEKLREFVELQTQKSGYSTKSDYIQQLVRQDMKRREQKKLKNMLLESLASGRKDYTQNEWLAFRDQVTKSVSS